ncbi:protein mono-ADP-ribosyltransferase PARP14-like isoform X2 [Mya arenaria]|uniref:protein mono-ADP-ribosyltransferase PARP14-like isoform X2 n=1 Tax=Mya arenaria TaxID=6604 RepID=UPI0022E76ECF|nr:protein mono-ADP-ribosyltransferase PARP14-like isoform X2 [Mya arenaria]
MADDGDFMDMDHTHRLREQAAVGKYDVPPEVVVQMEEMEDVERPVTLHTDSSKTSTRRCERESHTSNVKKSCASNSDFTDGGFVKVSELNAHTDQTQDRGTTPITKTLHPPLPPPRTPQKRMHRSSSRPGPIQVIDETLRRGRKMSLSPHLSSRRSGRFFGEETPIITSSRVVVKGLDEGVDLNSVRSFFEDTSRFGVGAISFIERCDITNAITIEFQTFEDAQSVILKARSGPLRLSVGKEMTIEPCPEKDQKCILVNGIDKSTAQADFADYLHEHCDIAKHTIQSIQFGTKEGAAVIHFDKPRPGIETIRKRLSKRPFRGKLLRFDEVDQWRTILVQKVNPNLSESDIVRYFLRNGGMIDTVHIYLPLNAFVVVFRFTEDAERVLSQNPHTISERALTVEPFFASLQTTSLNEIPTQEPLILNDLDRSIVRFIQNSGEYRKDLECELATLNGKVVWPGELQSDENDESDKHLKVICTIDPTQKPLKPLKVNLKNWQNNCLGIIEHFFQQFETTRTILVAKEVWNTFNMYLDASAVDDPKKKYRVVRKIIEFRSVEIVGKKEFTKDLYVKLTSKVDVLEKDFVASQKTDCLHKFVQLNYNEMSLLQYSRALEEKEMKPIPDTCGLEIWGEVHSITEVIDKIDRSINSYSREVLNTAKHGITCKTMDLLKTPQAKAYIAHIIDKAIGESSKASYIVDIDNNIEVCALDDKSLTEAIRIIRDSIKEKELKTLTPRHRAILSGHDGDILLTSLQQKHMGLFLSYKNKDGSISFVTIDSILEEVEEMISLFIDNHEVISEFIEVGSGRLAYLLTYKANELETIEDEYRPKGVKITAVEGIRNGFSIKGKKQYTREIGWRLHMMVDVIVERSHELKWDGFNECLEGNHAHGVQSKISVIGLEHKCVVKISPNKRHSRTNNRPNLIRTEFFTTIGSRNKSLYVVAGDITDIDADVVVVPSHSTLQLSGGIGRVVGAKGGFEIQKECCDIVKVKDGRVSQGDVFVTTSGNLSAKHLLHAVTPYKDDFEQDAVRILASLVDQCISKASALGGRSIVFPLIGTGQFNFDLNTVAEVLLTNILTFWKEENDNTLERVYICDMDVAKLKNVILQAKQMSDYKENDDSGEIPSNRQSGKSIQCDVTMETLAELQADVFVNATTRDMNLRIGALGKAILDEAGEEVVDDIKREYPDDIRYGEVAISITGRMKDRVRAFFHGHIPQWSPNNVFAEVILSRFVTECIQEANRRGHRSIAFPALGCGMGGYPPDIVVSTMLGAITEFSRTTPRTTVDLVKFVIPQTDLFEVFNEFVYENKSIETKSFVREYFGRSRSVNDFLLQRNSYQIQEGPVSIKLVLGNIIMESAHAIVNSTNLALNLKLGLVSSMILLTAGKVIQLECNTDEKKKQAQENKIVTTGPGRMLCKRIIHLVAGENKQQWEKKVKRCLRTAEAENLPIVSFPAIGTGRCGQPAHVIADVMATTVKKYVESTKYRGILRAIRIVIFDQEMLDVFRTTINKSLLSKEKQSGGIPIFFRRKESFETEADVKFHIFAETEEKAERVIQELESMKTEEKIAFPSSFLGCLTESQEHELKNIALRRRTVRVSIDKKDGFIAVTGLEYDVVRTRQEIERFLKKHSNVNVERPDHWNMNAAI